MKRILMVLAAAALMVVLMATTVSPAMADHHKNNTKETYGWGQDGYNGGCDDPDSHGEGWKWGKCTYIDYGE